MVDWNGLFKFSMSYNDNTNPSEFKPMSKEDAQWLEEAIKAYTFNDTERLTEIAKEIKDHQKFTKEKLLDLLDELSELVELHPRNHLNICLNGGMFTIFEIICTSEHDEVRQMAAQIFTICVQNNLEVQKIVAKMVPLNLIAQFRRESNSKNKEALMSSISAFIRGENLEGKREFFSDFEGLSFLMNVLRDEENLTPRLFLKTITLLYDLVINDDMTFQENPAYVRGYLIKNQEFVPYLFRKLDEFDLTVTQLSTQREYILRILKYLANYNKKLVDKFKPQLEHHKNKIQGQMKSKNEDLKDLLKKEKNLIIEVFNAPFLKIQSNLDNGQVGGFQTVQSQSDPKEEAKLLKLHA